MRDKRDRATAEQVLDPRTRMILFKLLQRGTIDAIEGCISTGLLDRLLIPKENCRAGKEANVYYAQAHDGPRAVKIYKTSILSFKDRDRYVTGEFRYRRGWSRHNPRKMVATWAEKVCYSYRLGIVCVFASVAFTLQEMRNLARMHKLFMPVPKPFVLKQHVLVMELIGANDEQRYSPAPLLKVNVCLSVRKEDIRHCRR